MGSSLWLVALLCLLQGATAACGVAYALLMRDAVDAAVAGSPDEFTWALAAFAGIILLQVLLGTTNRYTSERARASTENRLRAAAFSTALKQDARKASSRHSGELMTRFTSDVSAVSNGAVSFVPRAVSTVVRIASVLVAMVALAPQLALAFVALGCIIAGVSVSLRGMVKRLHKRQQEAEGEMRSYLQESLENLLVIHAFGAKDKIEHAAANRMDAHKRARMKRANASNVSGTGINLTMQVGCIVSFAWCGWGIVAGTMSYGTLMAVMQLVGQIQAPFASMGGVFSQYTAMIASAERLIEIESECKPERRSLENPQTVYERLRAIRLDGITFGYDGEPVLSGFSAEIPKGSFSLLAGPSGTGKSTLMKLLMGAYEPTEGHVILELDAGGTADRRPDGQAADRQTNRRAASHQPDGQAANARPQVLAASAHSQTLATAFEQLEAPSAPAGLFAYVPQGNHLMSGTIRETVAFSAEESAIDEARVREACRVACADAFISELPQGLDTQLGEGGAGLSEGQMQRLAVARAVYSNAPILLLDEATSSLDEQTEREMLARLSMLPGKTIIAITHRPAALELSNHTVKLAA